MPWLSEAKKDVASCEKLRGLATRIDPQMSEWGNPASNGHPTGGERRELKHLSTCRRRKQK